MKNDLKKSRLSANHIPLYIASWNGTSKVSGESRGKDGLTAIGDEGFNDYIGTQINKKYWNDFDTSFINYEKGVILCVNTPVFLNKFNYMPNRDNRISLIKFTVVLMPYEFVGWPSGLSSKYKIGEKLLVRSSLDKKGSGNSTIVYYDSNSKGRSRVKISSGSAAGVWS